MGLSRNKIIEYKAPLYQKGERETRGNTKELSYRCLHSSLSESALNFLLTFLHVRRETSPLSGNDVVFDYTANAISVTRWSLLVLIPGINLRFTTLLPTKTFFFWSTAAARESEKRGVSYKPTQIPYLFDVAKVDQETCGLQAHGDLLDEPWTRQSLLNGQPLRSWRTIDASIILERTTYPLETSLETSRLLVGCRLDPEGVWFWIGGGLR